MKKVRMSSWKDCAKAEKIWMMKAYMDYGALLLEQEYKYTNDIYTHLMELEKGI